MSDSTIAALPQTCYPTVWLWPGRALYAGPGLDLRPHSGSVWCLAFGADRELTVTAGRTRVVARSVLVPPRIVHHLDTHGGRLVSCYVDASSDRVANCRSRMTCDSEPFAINHVHVASLTSVPGSDDDAARWLDVAAPEGLRRRDPRITDAVKRILADPVDSPPAHQLAADLGLSESRFLHLFRDEVGTSLRRYRLWARLISAGVALGSGSNLTQAAAAAGFSSPSHLSDRFRSTFGLSATELLGRGTVIRVPRA